MYDWTIRRNEAEVRDVLLGEKKPMVHWKACTRPEILVSIVAGPKIRWENCT